MLKFGRASKGLLALLLIAILTSCGGSQISRTVRTGNTAQSSQPTATPTQLPTPQPAGRLSTGATPVGQTITTVFVIVMENHNWADIYKNPSAPYINNTLLPMASFARQYYNPPGIHPSEPNYLWMEAGTNFGIYNDDVPAANHLPSTMHLVTLLKNAGISWKAYQEGIDGSVCPLSIAAPYAPKHNPMVYFDDVTDTNNPHSAYCIVHERPFSELATDLRKHVVARYNFITPNLCDDMHDSCAPLYNSIKQGDTWLSQRAPLILNSQAYQNGGVLFITWDEGAGGDGPIGMIVLAPDAKGKGYSNAVYYTHSSLLRTIEEIFGVAPLLGDAAHASDLRDLFSVFP